MQRKFRWRELQSHSAEKSRFHSAVTKWKKKKDKSTSPFSFLDPQHYHRSASRKTTCAAAAAAAVTAAHTQVASQGTLATSAAGGGWCSGSTQARVSRQLQVREVSENGPEKGPGRPSG